MKPLRDQIAEAIVEASLVSHSNAFPIADAVLRVVGNGTIKALEEKITRLECRNASLRKKNAVLRGHNRAYKAQLRNMMPKRWTEKEINAFLEKIAP